MSFGDNHMVIPNPLTTAANSLAEEVTSTGKVEYVAPCDMDIEQFGLLIAVTLGNTITTASGFQLCKVDAAGTETVLETIKPCNNTNGWYAGDGSAGGGTVAAATTFAFAAGSILSRRMQGTPSHFIAQGEIIRMRGSTTAGSATGDVVPFVVCRMAGKGLKSTNCYNEGVLTRANNA
ncbi:MAG TPA: hypothetical protein VH593_32740 [Ktedonobacteraceae bacterium]|jgi:hypothetical protein